MAIECPCCGKVNCDCYFPPLDPVTWVKYAIPEKGVLCPRCGRETLFCNTCTRMVVDPDLIPQPNPLADEPQIHHTHCPRCDAEFECEIESTPNPLADELERLPIHEIAEARPDGTSFPVRYRMLTEDLARRILAALRGK